MSSPNSASISSVMCYWLKGINCAISKVASAPLKLCGKRIWILDSKCQPSTISPQCIKFHRSSSKQLHQREISGNGNKLKPRSVANGNLHDDPQDAFVFSGRSSSMHSFEPSPYVQIKLQIAHPPGFWCCQGAHCPGNTSSGSKQTLILLALSLKILENKRAYSCFTP